MARQPQRDAAEMNQGIVHRLLVVSGGAFLLPHRGMFPGLLDLEVEQVALSLEEPCRKSPDLIQRQDESCEAEHGAVVVAVVISADVGTDMAKFVKIGDIGHRLSSGPRCTKARAGARAPVDSTTR